MSERIDFEISGQLKARQLRAIQPPITTTVNEHVRTERTERRAGAADQLKQDETYDELEIEKRLRGEITPD